MRRKWPISEERYFGIGVYRPKTAENVGSLWRTAYILGADYIFLIDAKYKKQASDVLKVWSKIPLFQFEDFESFRTSMPYSCRLIGIEQDKTSIPIKDYEHHGRAVYLLGSEDNGLPKEIKEQCHELIELPGESSMNVAVAGSIVVFDRVNKLG